MNLTPFSRASALSITAALTLLILIFGTTALMAGCTSEQSQRAIGQVAQHTADRLESIADQLDEQSQRIIAAQQLLADIEHAAEEAELPYEQWPTELQAVYDAARTLLAESEAARERLLSDAEVIRADAEARIAEIQANDDPVGNFLQVVGSIVSVGGLLLSPQGAIGGTLLTIGALFAGRRLGEHKGAEGIAASIAHARAGNTAFDSQFNDESVARLLRESIGDNKVLRKAIVSANQEEGIK